jgi:hypothetical protein
MPLQELTETSTWAEEQWGAAQLQDQRRNRSAVQLGRALAAQPAASLPTQTGSWGKLKAAYRLLNEEDVTHPALIAPHCRATHLQAAATQGVVLFIQDTSDGDYTHHPQTSGLGSIGDGRGRGFLMHNSLAVVPLAERALILGLAGQRLWLRPVAKRKPETRTARSQKWQESAVWAEMLEQIGVAPADGSGTAWVSVADRASDNFAYWRRARELHWHLLSRVMHDRRLETVDGTQATLKSFARSLPAATSKRIRLRGRDGQAQRTVELQISYAEVIVQAPRSGKERKSAPIAAGVVRCWEESDSAEAIEWILLTSLEVTTSERAQEIVQWYTQRWLIEEYHKCLKTGCRLEARQLESGAALMRLLGFLAIVAVRLLQMREVARQEPETVATEQVSQELIELVIKRVGLPRSVEGLTSREFWHGVARLGGFIGRKSDGEPGWQTVWSGWQRLQDMSWGAAFKNSS